MTTKLEKPIRREITVDGVEYTLVIDVAGLTLTRKRFRNGRSITWRQIVAGNGETAPAAIAD